MAGTNRKALLKPFQLVGLSAVFGVFVLLIVLLTTRNLLNGLIAAGVVFILSLVVLAMLVLSYKPNAESTAYLDRFEPERQAADADAEPGDDLDAELDAVVGEPERPGPSGGSAIGDRAIDGGANDDDAADDDAARRADDARRNRGTPLDGSGGDELP
ncbi:hypothetical protein GCM10011490_19540 [Pseudoclavibacter endophyticus]|uniref:Uncharacterized protein n=1 Tax=Pseudoclavibacter endophyticus TaxID=1778590 RepID=A0A6H9WBJ6_9MICO|nr:hypothetical protein [Pseudoclavibacter endophyticus]KAB1648020.1 hypothetical protein F8O04_09805 [Pseudoclavibacter endophyticus]GGA69083.1 hypothetical protein GCM10011490_19540 [Pseudoclavibacter endophyticus]